MLVVCDVEANGLDPTEIHVVVCKRVDTGEVRVFRNHVSFTEFASGVRLWIGHNFLSYDKRALEKCWNVSIAHDAILDTLVLSRLFDATLTGKNPHGIEAWGARLGHPKVGADITDWSVWTQEMQDRCVSDVEINFLLYKRFQKFIESDKWQDAIKTEHFIAQFCQLLHTNGFAFNLDAAKELKARIEKEVARLDAELKEAFAPREKLIREFTPRLTKHGTIAKNSVPKALGPDLTAYEAGKTYRHTILVPFNGASHDQRIDRLWEAGWRPEVKSDTHRDAQKLLQKLRRKKGFSPERRAQIAEIEERLGEYGVSGYGYSGWKSTDEENLRTLPDDAPPEFKKLTRFITLRNRISTLESWFENACLLLTVTNENLNINESVERTRSIGQRNGSGADFTLRTDASAIRNGLLSVGSERRSADTNESTELLQQTLNEWLKSKRAVAQFVASNDGSLSITVTPLDRFAGYSAEDVIQISDGLKTIFPRSSITYTVHGSFAHIGAWTHRMAHSAPNLGNVPKFDAKQPDKTPYSDEMRRLWIAGKDRYLVGVDADSIQLRIFGHYINDKDFIHALCSGDKKLGTDPHSLNARALGTVCRSRDDAKTFIYAWLLGAGLQKVAAILGCTLDEAREANENFLDFYPGLKFLKDKIIPVDASRGYFQGFDGRYVRIWGEDDGERRHFTLAGYLQCGEAVIMKRATQIWYPKLLKEKVPFWPVNFVHDEWQVETVRNMEVAQYVASTIADSIRQVGEDLKLNCPMAGSTLSGHGKIAIADNWYDTH